MTTMLDDTQRAYLADFKQRHSLDDVIAWLDKAAKLKPVVVGESIIDQYEFGEAVGKANKDATLALIYDHTETYAGGSLAIANHLAGLCDTVRLVTELGSIDRQEEFIIGALRHNILTHFLTKYDAPTICKKRTVELYSGVKLLEVIHMNDTPLDNPYQQDIKAALSESLQHSDLVLASDFGHGFLTERVIRQLWAGGVFLSVMAQSNAGNRGFNPISKYRRADYCCIANHEVDLELRERNGDPKAKLIEIAKRIVCPRWTVTMGKWGSLHFDALEERFYEAPALATKIVDRVGAGDSVFAVTSLLAKLCCPWDVLAFLGNVTGAVAVEELGNKKTIDRKTLEARIRELMK